MDEQAIAELSYRERQVFNCLLLGQRPKDIAEKYGLVRNTVTSISSRIVKKLGFASVPEMMKFAKDNKWVRDVKPLDGPVQYETIEGAAGPQARFIVGTMGNFYYRFERRYEPPKRIGRERKLGICNHKILDIEYASGYKGVSSERLTDYRRVFSTRYLAELEPKFWGFKDVYAAPHRDGFCLVCYPGQRNAATLRVSRDFIREDIEGQPTNPAFAYLLGRNYGMASSTTGQHFQARTPTNLTTALNLSNNTWYSFSNPGLVPVHYKQILTTATDPVYGDSASQFHHTIEPGAKADLFMQETGLALWVWCDHGVGFIAMSEAE